MIPKFIHAWFQMKNNSLRKYLLLLALGKNMPDS